MYPWHTIAKEQIIWYTHISIEIFYYLKRILMYSPFNGTIAQSTIELSFVKINHLYNDSLCEKFFVQITIKLKVLMDGITKTLFHKSLFIRHLIVMPTSSYSRHLHLKERPINLLFFCVLN